MSITGVNEPFESLSSNFSGTVLGPDDAGYDTARAIWNGSIQARPALIAQCGSTEDIVTAVTATRDAGLQLAVRGGGHSVAGLCLSDGGVVVDLS